VVTWAQDLGQARDVMLAAAAAAPGIRPEPSPTATVVSADAGGVTLRIEAWTDARDQERAIVALGWAIAGALAELRRSQTAA
jgi:small-conductance mechanosensitive channel